MTKRKGSLSTVVDFMSDDAQVELRERAGILSPLPLVAILPDPNQPRQLLPADLAEQVQTGQISPLEAVGEWQKRGKTKTAEPAMKRDIEELERLANSIAQHGLINPISVRRVPGNANVPDGVKYLIITGERRYWAHALLAAGERTVQEGFETTDPHTIKATIAPEGISIRAHQIVENVMREDIDAVEKAQGFLALRYELSGQDIGGEPAERGGTMVPGWCHGRRSTRPSTSPTATAATSRPSSSSTRGPRRSSSATGYPSAPSVRSARSSAVSRSCSWRR